MNALYETKAYKTAVTKGIPDKSSIRRYEPEYARIRQRRYWFKLNTARFPFEISVVATERFQCGPSMSMGPVVVLPREPLPPLTGEENRIVHCADLSLPMAPMMNTHFVVGPGNSIHYLTSPHTAGTTDHLWW